MRGAEREREKVGEIHIYTDFKKNTISVKLPLFLILIIMI
jgi:hypothetical protein